MGRRTTSHQVSLLQGYIHLGLLIERGCGVVVVAGGDMAKIMWFVCFLEPSVAP